MPTRSNERLCELAQAGDTAARDILLENNLGFIRKIALEQYRSMDNETVVVSKEKSKGSSCFGFLQSLFNMVERMSPPKYTAITSRSKTAISLINIIRTLIFFVSFL